MEFQNEEINIKSCHPEAPLSKPLTLVRQMPSKEREVQRDVVSPAEWELDRQGKAV